MAVTIDVKVNHITSPTTVLKTDDNIIWLLMYGSDCVGAKIFIEDAKEEIDLVYLS